MFVLFAASCAKCHKRDSQKAIQHHHLFRQSKHPIGYPHNIHDLQKQGPRLKEGNNVGVSSIRAVFRGKKKDGRAKTVVI